MGTIGFALKEGLTTTDPSEAFTKELVMGQARQVIVLADSSKAGKVSFARAGGWDKVHVLITDKQLDKEFREGTDQERTSSSCEPETEKKNFMKKSPTYLSDSRPKFEPFEIDCGKIPAYRYNGESRSPNSRPRRSPPPRRSQSCEDMLVIRELEEMIVKLRSGAYEPIRDYNYRGPTHVSVGQEGTAAGACCALQLPTTSPAPTAATAKASPRAPSPSAR